MFKRWNASLACSDVRTGENVFTTLFLKAQLSPRNFHVLPKTTFGYCFVTLLWKPYWNTCREHQSYLHRFETWSHGWYCLLKAEISYPLHDSNSLWAFYGRHCLGKDSRTVREKPFLEISTCSLWTQSSQSIAARKKFTTHEIDILTLSSTRFCLSTLPSLVITLFEPGTLNVSSSNSLGMLQCRPWIGANPNIL